MELQPITQVSKAYGVSTRTLRYYEQLGLLHSSRLPGYAWRAYDEAAMARLRQILVLRLLRIPLKQIGEILDTRDAQLAIQVFEQGIAQTQDEMQALETIQGLLRSFVAELEKLLPAPLSPKVFEQQQVLQLVQALSVKTLSTREEPTMDELKKANETLTPPSTIRILYLPPMTVAAFQSTGESQEEYVGGQITAFIQSSGLAQLKPDFRRLGFNNPMGPPPTSLGYEAWVSIPEDMAVPAPLQRKRFLGGLYAACAIPFGEFQEWPRLWDWVNAHDQYEVDWPSRIDPSDDKADPSLEEQLNAIHHLEDTTPFGTQLDLLIPLKPKG